MGWFELAWPRVSIRKVDQHLHFEPLWVAAESKVRAALRLSKLAGSNPQRRSYNAPKNKTMFSNNVTVMHCDIHTCKL